MRNSLAGKVAFITGNAGIGLATAALFAEAGTHVVIAAEDKGKQAEEALRTPGRSALLATDVSDAAGGDVGRTH